MLAQFQATGRDLFLRGLVSSHSGNLSQRQGERLLITRRGSQLGRLGTGDLVVVSFNLDDAAAPLASRELPVHRAIYQATEAGAVVHAHPPYAIALSLALATVVPADLEGSYLLKEVPVLDLPGKEPREVAPGVASALRQARVVLVKGHGSFAAGKDLEEAYQCTSTLEASCQILWLQRLLSPQRFSG